MKWTNCMLLLLGLSLFACKSTKDVVSSQAPDPVVAEADEPRAIVEMQLTPDWAPKYKGENPSHTRTFDLIHTALDLRFDWGKQHVLGKARLLLKPYFYPAASLSLDAKGFDIHQLALVNGSNQKELKYTYDGEQLHIELDQPYTRQDTLQLYIAYTAKPAERATSGSEAITSDQGLYFINPDGSEPDKPTQIWTQGEPQSNSCWFPTIDWPNERCSQETRLTVEEKYVTVSNGRLVSSTSNGDGTRTDYWKQELPHAPYLFAVVVGEFVVTPDKWRDKEVNYYMEAKYAPYARLIFGHTPEMMEYFSNALGVDYPWDKYAQVVVRDFVSGAMENTSCAIFYDALNHDARQHLDETNEDIIVHELFHHWFGDLVTMESFANLPLNESFATYSEALWFRHKYGEEEADYHLEQDLQNYLSEAETKREPLIRFHHGGPDDMFDAHSYQKGGRVLHMLLHEVGEEAFWASLNLYLTRNAYTDVEIDELRLAFEDVTGRDLRWFFDQWFLEPGHPELEVNYRITRDENGQQLVQVGVEQVQDLRYMPVYRLPLSVQITDTEGNTARFPVEMTNRDTTFVIEYAGNVGNVIYDADQILLGVKEESKPYSYWLNQLTYGQNYKQKQQAIEQLTAHIKKDEVVNALLLALKDDFWATRLEALQALSQYGEGARRKKIVRETLRMAREDEKSEVRKTAIQVFADDDAIKFAQEKELGSELDNMLIAGLKDSSYNVNAAALQALTFRSPREAIAIAKEFAHAPSPSLMGICTLILMQVDDPADFETVLNNLRRIPASLEQAQIVQGFGPYLQNKSEAQQKAAVEVLKKIAADGQVWWIRYSALQILSDYTSQPEIQEFFRQRLQADSDENIKEYCQEVVGG